MSNDLATLDCIAQAVLVRRGDVSPRELGEAAVARAERLDPRIHAIISPQYQRALDQARRL